MVEKRDKRKSIPAPIQAALWALSNGRCYAPDCPFPVIFEVRPGIYKKNAQIAHIYGVQPGSARHRPCRTLEEEQERDSFRNLILLCLAHHAEVDDKKTGEDLYPPELLLEWKLKHEGDHGKHLARISNPMTDDLIEALLVEAFEPPTARLERIAEQLERTGSLNIDALQELRQVISVMNDATAGVDNLTASRLAYAAEVFDGSNLSRAAASLSHAAETLPGVLRSLDDKLRRLGGMI